MAAPKEFRSKFFHAAAARLQHSCSQTRLFQPEYGPRIRRKLLNPNNRT